MIKNNINNEQTLSLMQLVELSLKEEPSFMVKGEPRYAETISVLEKH